MAAPTRDDILKRVQRGEKLDRADLRGLDLSRPRGLIARYICSTCGFVELFCEDPESIPIGPEYMSDVVDYGGDKPYR